jgi:multiple sugar transport system permease protein
MNTPSKYTLSLALNMFLDPNAYNNYGGLFAMSVLSLLPTLIFFIIFQRYLVDGIAMDGIKG